MSGQIITGRVLFVGAHPDDIEIGCGGTAAKCVKEGREIAFAIATGGKDHSTALVRENEARKAAKMLGLSESAGNLFLGHFPDTRLTERQDEVRTWLSGVSKAFRPQTVFTHRPDSHTDHQAIYSVSVGVFEGKHVLLYYIPRQSPDKSFEPNHGQDISSFIKKKVAMCKCHKSQDGIYIGKDSVRTNAHKFFIDWFGRNSLKKDGYAEAFFIHASRSPIDLVNATDGPILNYKVRVVEKADGTRRWETEPK